jgi:hypothetical protein
MSISLDARPALDAAAQALDFLRGRPNPFENLVRPQRPDDHFLDLHVPALLREPRELLLAVIDAYRLEEYRTASDLPDSRVVTILGQRGAGKTHLLDAVAYRDDNHRQLLVRPPYFETGVAFEEFLLGQLVNALLTVDLAHGVRPLDAIAFVLTRLLLRQVLSDLGPVERLLLAAPKGWSRYLLLWHGGEKLALRIDRFRQAVTTLSAGDDLGQLARAHGLSPELLVRLIEDHVRRWEDGDDALPAIRRQLLPALARTSLLHETNAITQFLEADYAPANARPFLRAEVVRQLLFALVETCALVRLPVVVAFDNLEGLLAPQGKLDTERVRALFDNLAQAVDASRGLLFLVFAEEGLHREFRKEIHSFALARIDQGVPIHGRGPVDMIELRPPGAEELSELIAGRVGKSLRGVTATAALPKNFPFGAGFIAELAGRSGAELRNKLLRLRDEYSRIVYRREPPGKDAAPPFDWTAELTRLWDHHVRTASQRGQARELVTLDQDLYAGLRQLLQQCGPLRAHGMDLATVQPMTTTDGHGTYSKVTVVDWRLPGDTDSTGEGRPAFRLCVGLLLGLRGGMPRDLRAKFTTLAETSFQPDLRLILWPTDAEQELPTATRKVWDENHEKHPAVLHRLGSDDVYKLLAIPEWVKEVRGKGDPQAPDGDVQNFVRQRCQALLALLCPTDSFKGSEHAH